MHVLINIDVDDLARGVAFYTQAFGWQEARHLGDSVIELLGAQAPVYLLRKPAGTPAVAGQAAPRHYARHWTPVQRALAAGAVLEQAAQTHPWGRLALLADPFGHGFCLLQFLGRGYDEGAAA